MAKTADARTVSVSINRDVAEVYRYLADPHHFERWASGLGQSLRCDGAQWVASTLHGEVRVRFTPVNAFGVLDHTVYPAQGGEVYVPMRAVANGAGCEVLLTLFRQPGMTDAKFQEDAHWVERDLMALKALLEA